MTQEQRKEYLETLDRKALRLKALIEDLFEVSKANSRNITLDIRDVDIVSMVKQVEFEMEDKLTDAGLEVRMSLPEEKVVVPLDSQKTFRIFENLFGNMQVCVTRHQSLCQRFHGKRGCDDHLKKISRHRSCPYPERN